eukprot:1142409-Pelagomonas_calceolata.AAC.7
MYSMADICFSQSPSANIMSATRSSDRSICVHGSVRKLIKTLALRVTNGHQTRHQVKMVTRRRGKRSAHRSWNAGQFMWVMGKPIYAQGSVHTH